MHLKNMDNPASEPRLNLTDIEYFEQIYQLGVSNGMTIEHQLFKQKVLNILKTPIQNLDLSFEECDIRFIEKIEAL